MALRLALFVCTVSAGLLGPATLANSASVYQSKRLWATVNVCDTAAKPNTIGIRASMPGSGIKNERMFMRFEVQYFKPSDGKWHNIGATGDSGFLYVGTGTFKRRESGRDFKLKAPVAGQSFRVRGAVTFEWRRKSSGEVVRRARKSTTGGHKGSKGADPEDFSAAECTIT